MADINVTIIDREGNSHELVGPTDMSMNIMELCKAYELPVLGECGAWPCVQLVNAIWNLTRL